MLNVALTGNIAAGKSTVVDLFQRWGATIIDADALAREAQAPGGEVRPAIAASTSPPGAWASRASASASMIVAPQRWNRSTTVDFPAAMLPVRATFSMSGCWG